MNTKKNLKNSKWLPTLLLLALLFVPKYVLADDAVVLAQIEKANANVKTLVSPFTQTKVVAATGTKKNLAGTLYYSAPDKVAQHYTQPASDLFLINGNQLCMARNGKKLHFDTGKNATMCALRNTLIYCIQGRTRTLAAENSADITVSSDAKHYIVTLTSKKKLPHGYKTIVLHYTKSDATLHIMQMDEFNGNSTIYTMTNYAIDQPVDATVFAIPEK